MKTLISTTYNTYLKQYECFLKDSKENVKSIKSRIGVVSKFLDFLTKYPDLVKFQEIDRGHVQSFLFEAEEKGFKAKTLNRYFSFLKHFFLYYKKENVNTNSIFDNWKYNVHGEVNSIVLSDDEIKNLKLGIAQLFTKNGVNDITLRTELEFLLLLYSGCTKTELCTMGLYKNNPLTVPELGNYILLEDRKVVFSSNKRNGIKKREMPLHNKLYKKIIQYIEFMEENKGINFDMLPYLFLAFYEGKFDRMTDSTITLDIKSIVQHSRVENKNISFQAIRNTFINRLIKKQVPLQIIRDLTGLEYASLKKHISDLEQYENSLKEELLLHNHPFEKLF